MLSNMLPSIEQHVDWIADCIGAVRERELSRIEPTEAAEELGRARQRGRQRDLYPSCNSWYLGANIPGKPRVFMPYLGFPAYVQSAPRRPLPAIRASR